MTFPAPTQLLWWGVHETFAHAQRTLQSREVCRDMCQNEALCQGILLCCYFDYEWITRHKLVAVLFVYLLWCFTLLLFWYWVDYKSQTCLLFFCFNLFSLEVCNRIYELSLDSVTISIRYADILHYKTSSDPPRQNQWCRPFFQH